MRSWKLCFVLLLLLSFCSHIKASQGPLLKIIREQPDLTPICSNKTQITVIVCKNSTEMSRGKDCYLLYRYPRGFAHDCDSRFTLKTINQTVFLHLENLTPADSGSFTCDCSYAGGTKAVKLNITVQEYEDTTTSTKTSSSNAVIGMIAIPIIILTGVTLGVFCRSVCHGKRNLVTMTTTNSYYSTVTYTVTDDIRANLHLQAKRETRIYSAANQQNSK